MSKALWIATLWLLLSGSRTFTEWWALGAPRHTLDQFVESNPVERNVLLGLITIGTLVLAARGRRTLALLRTNPVVLTFLIYAAASITWSDYPDIAFKRWIKALGDLVMIAIVVSDAAPASALKRLLARASFILVPASVLCIKYYPAIGQTYGRFDGKRHVVGIAEDKNMLGLTCLVFGVAAIWRVRHAYRQSAYRQVVAHGTILLMVTWLSAKADSVTSLACFALAAVIVMLTTSPTFGQRRLLVHTTMVTLISFVFAVLFLNVGAFLVESMGRDPTITGRTALWQQLLGMNPNPLFGAGFETFWLGPRIEELWKIFAWAPNEAHNGYLEVFLNLGIIGLTLLLTMIAIGYRNAAGLLRTDSEGASLRLAYLFVGLTYSFTEAGFRMMNPVWIAFVLSAIRVPASVPAPVVARREQPTATPAAIAAPARIGTARRRPVARLDQAHSTWK